MRLPALAADYDGTLAVDGRVDDRTLRSLVRLRAAGRRLVLVTGRRLPHVLSAFPAVEVCDRVVAENGALLYRPDSGEERWLAPAPPAALVEELERRGVEPLGRGRVILATHEPHGPEVAAAIRDLGLAHQVILNKGAVMVLPPGVDKASGLAAALDELGLAPVDAVGVGDAENDWAFLVTCGRSVAVANALPALKERADLVTRGEAGEGVEELVERMLADDLAGLESRAPRS
ncbi:MAG: Cof-type HAD-IIB family hydrolase [Actinobacteria bacterium]|nr:Cof-type HAD-IIB family hydrolase [Actinomycetota bacterium]